MTSIAGVKWFHRPCRLGCSTTAADQRLFVPALARPTVRTTQRAVRLSGPRCSRVSAPLTGIYSFANLRDGCNSTFQMIIICFACYQRRGDTTFWDAQKRGLKNTMRRGRLG